VAALEAFLAVASQWRIGPQGRALGLDYAGAQAGLALAGITVTPALWADLREIERGARMGLNGETE
jgi:Phage related hypothetical protein (DUF1799)